MTPVSPVSTHPAVTLLRRSHELVAAHPALLPLRQRLALIAWDPRGRDDMLRDVVRKLRRSGHNEAADHAGHALLLLAILPVPAASAAAA